MEETLVADSFRTRVRGGATEVRGFSLHLERFRASVAEVFSTGPGDEWWDRVFEPFLREAPERIARGGEGFPRLEARTAGIGTAGAADRGTAPVLDVRIRPLPPLGTEIALRSASGAPLASPRVKGPNISSLARLNRELGAEALLLDAEGRVREGATTSLLWWQGDVLCMAASHDRVASVTERLLLRLAEQGGVEIRGCAATPAEIARHEAWAVNALHGIRTVSAIDGEALPEPDRARLDRFREALDRSWEIVAPTANPRLPDVSHTSRRLH